MICAHKNVLLLRSFPYQISDQFFTLIRVFEDKMHTPLEDSIVEGFNRNEGLDDDRANVQ